MPVADLAPVAAGPLRAAPRAARALNFSRRPGTQRAGRFSRNEAMPSWPSSLAKNRADSSSRSSNRSVGPGAQQPLGLGQGGRGAGGQLDQLGAQFAVHVGVGDDEVDQPAVGRGRGVEHLAGEHQPVRDVRHHPRQARRRR